MSGSIYLKDGDGQTLATTTYAVATECNEWEDKVKVRVHAWDNTLAILKGSEILLEHKLTFEQISEISSHLGFSAYSSSQGRYRVGGISIDRVPFER